jgi:hypothetical protein
MDLCHHSNIDAMTPETPRLSAPIANIDQNVKDEWLKEKSAKLPDVVA